MITLADTLPQYSVISGDNLTTLWNYVGSVFYMGMPVLLIMVALIIIPYVIDLIFEAVRKARADDSKEESDYWDD